MSINGPSSILTHFRHLNPSQQIRAYCSTTSAELTTAPSESELDTAGLSRSEEDLNKLAASYDIVSKMTKIVDAKREAMVGM